MAGRGDIVRGAAVARTPDANARRRDANQLGEDSAHNFARVHRGILAHEIMSVPRPSRPTRDEVVRPRSMDACEAASVGWCLAALDPLIRATQMSSRQLVLRMVSIKKQARTAVTRPTPVRRSWRA
jgi:hypothetical protein